ncbi:hypothetical protein [Fodinicola feengrottensis]|nr:hypothetical protein [Fodinicola feengrottensis]
MDLPELLGDRRRRCDLGRDSRTRGQEFFRGDNRFRTPQPDQRAAP